MVNKEKFIVVDIKKETDDTVTIFLSSAGEKLSYRAGQYVALYFDEKESSQGKFYTISSSPAEKYVALSVKKIGQFSSLIHDLKVNDTIFLSGPFGYFYPETEENSLVFLAAGIGVTPFLSIVKDYADRDIKREIDLYYTNKTLKDIAFFQEVNKLAKKCILRIHYYLTRDTTKHELISGYERIKAVDIKRDLGALNKRDYYICGPISFVTDMRKQLLALKVKEKNIFTESFF